MNHSGEMTEVVTLSAPVGAVDRYGQRTSWNAVADVAARVKPLVGREFFAAGAMQSPAELEVEIYYRPDVQSHWRVTWMSRIFEVVGAPIDVNARHATLLLMCGAVAGV